MSEMEHDHTSEAPASPRQDLDLEQDSHQDSTHQQDPQQQHASLSPILAPASPLIEPEQGNEASPQLTSKQESPVAKDEDITESFSQQSASQPFNSSGMLAPPTHSGSASSSRPSSPYIKRNSLAPSEPTKEITVEMKPRLVIEKMVLKNFKSYAGRQEIGPFHKSFTSVVGPNGSGKSNVIDALLFVFGYRASKMRQGKLSELIHNSSGAEDLDSCAVEVHFCEILDLV